MPKRTAPLNPSFRGWFNDQANDLLEAYHGTTRLFGSNATTLTIDRNVDMSAGSVTLPTRSAKLDLMNSVLKVDGTVLTATEAAGTFNRSLGTNQFIIRGEVTISETEVSVGVFSVQLPSDYKSGGTITVNAGVDLVGAGTAVTSSIDFEAYLQNETAGTVGSDLVTTAAQTISATEALEAFTVTPTGLVAGDRLNFKMTTSVAETGAASITADIHSLYLTYQADK